jgi:sterol desaturase/sphingolipid hydroxylase (fatty acid hydroxylase superfamily)
MDFSPVLEIIKEVLQVPFSYLLSPSKRVFVLYLVTSGIIAYYVFKSSKLKGNFLRYIFNKKVWVGKSALIDYGLIFFNALVKVIVLTPFFAFALYLANKTEFFLINKFGEQNFGFTTMQIVISYTVLIVVVNDFVTFIIHYIMHKVPFLWEFHKIHHSATELNPFTQYRIHPVELIVNNLGEVFSKAILTGIFLYLAEGKVSIITFLGVNILNFLFYFFGANLRHSHVKLKYFNFLEYFLISPFQHQIHHSNNPEHYDTNLGSRFAFWDWMFGTLRTSKTVSHIEFGLGEEEDKYYDSFLKNLVNPFINLKNKVFRKNT